MDDRDVAASGRDAQLTEAIRRNRREVRLVAAARTFIAVTKGGVLEQNAYWAELRDALGAYPLLLPIETTALPRWRRLLAALRAVW